MTTEALSPASGIYAIQNVISGKRYVGSAVSIRKRWTEHRRDLALGRHKNSKLQRAWNKYGSDQFRFVILEHVESLCDLITREQHWMDKLEVVASGFNILPIAGSCLGRKHSQETRDKIKAAAIGRPFSVENIERLAEARRGQKQSPEVIAKRSAALTGHLVSDETRAKISAANTGKKQPPESIAKRLAAIKGIPFSQEHRLKLSIAGRGKAQSQEARMKISIAHIGRRHSEEHRKKNSLAQSGKTLSQEHKDKIGAGNSGKVLSAETKKLLSIAKKGIPLSEAHKQKLKESHVGMKGKKHSPETIERMRVAQKAAAANKKAATLCEAENVVLSEDASCCVEVN
ncbi:GIY-YIG nuclease family protein [Pseudomonas yamanorum]|nr:GIY-YIG nuclease family protein [Pseudomonas yamanorum]